MSWMQDLVTAYDENEKFAGKTNGGFKFLLPPVGHIIQNAQIELTLNENGDFFDARVLEDKQEQATLIPCTPDSASRTNAPSPHPLHDNLSYIARDYGEFAPKVKGNAHEDYVNLLRKWVEFAPENQKLRAVLTYVENHDPIHDLIEYNVLPVDENHKLLTKWDGDKDEKPPILRAVAGDLLKSSVRFCVRLEDDDQPNLWEDEKLQESWQKFLLESGFLAEKQKNEKGKEVAGLKKGLCYVTGEEALLSDKHGKGIRFPGDGAKLISSNDADGFTFRGRFDEPEECVGISYEASQKAMNALMWLARNQGYKSEGRVFLAWANQGQKIPSAVDSTLGMFHTFALNRMDEKTAGTQAQWAGELKKALAGMRHKFAMQKNVKVNVMILDAASKGRLSICYYDTMNGTDFIDRIEKWHTLSAWRNHSYDVEQKASQEYFGVPSPKRILETCIGDKAGDSQKSMEFSRIFRAIVQGKSLPMDMEREAMGRVARSANQGRSFVWWQALETTCSIICNRRNYAGEENQVALDEQNTNRSYLFGRLLAVADQMERRTFDKDEKRATNAMRLMEAFVARPQKTWLYLQQRLMPYQEKREAKGGWEKRELFKIGSLFREEDFMSDKPLDGRYLLGFYCQEYAMQKAAEEGKKKKDAAQGEDE